MSEKLLKGGMVQVGRKEEFDLEELGEKAKEEEKKEGFVEKKEELKQEEEESEKKEDKSEEKREELKEEEAAKKIDQGESSFKCAPNFVVRP